ncbi:MAG: DHH family phosphoesterase [Deltaproteobacteria bacterium]
MRSVSGVEVCLLFREQKHDWRVSLRSRGKVNVGRLAGLFGGGGHIDSAGLTVPKSWRNIRAVLTVAKRAVRARG